MKKSTIASRWWFYPFLILISLMLPPFVQNFPSSAQEAATIIFTALSNPVYNNIPVLFPIAKVITVLVILLSFYRPSSFGKYLAIYGFLSMAFIGVFQNISNTEKFGMVWIISNTFLMFIVAIHWLHEMKNPNLGLKNMSKNKLKYMIIPLMLFPVIFPVSFTNEVMIWDFSLRNVFLNESCMTYCMVTPVLLGLQILCYPKYNYYLLKISSFIGMIFSIYNMAAWFVFNPRMWMMGVMHFPLLILSLMGVVITFFINKKEEEVL